MGCHGKYSKGVLPCSYCTRGDHCKCTKQNDCTCSCIRPVVLLSYNGHVKGCVCSKCGEARDIVKLINIVFNAEVR